MASSQQNPNVKVVLRAPANRAFVQGYPGLPEPDPTRDVRPRAVASGTVELRTNGKPLKAEWLTISLIKTETLPKEVGGLVFRDNIHGSISLWSAPPGTEYGILDSKDFPFALDVPQHLPSSVDVHQGAYTGPIPGITYHLEVTLMERNKKKGLLRKEHQPLSTFHQPVEVLAHGLHPSWPAHRQTRVVRMPTPSVEMSLTLANAALSPGTILQLPLILLLAPTGPTYPSPIVVRNIQLSLVETLTLRSGERDPPPTGPFKTVLKRPTTVSQSRLEAGPGELVLPGPQGGRSWLLQLNLPSSRLTGEGNLGFSVDGTHLSVSYGLKVEVFGGVQGRMDGGGLGANGGLGELVAVGAVEDVLVDWMQASREADTVREIGFVPGLSMDATPSPSFTSAHSFSSSGPYNQPRSNSYQSVVSPAPMHSPPPSQPPPSQLPASTSWAPQSTAQPTTQPAADRRSSSMSFEQTYNPLPRSSPGRPKVASPSYLPEEDEFFGSISPSPPPSTTNHSADLGNGRPASRGPALLQGHGQTTRYPSAQEEKALAFAKATAAVSRVQDNLPSDDAPLKISTLPARAPTSAAGTSRAGSNTYVPPTTPASAASPSFESAADEKRRIFEQLQYKAAVSQALASGEPAPPMPQSMLLPAQVEADKFPAFGASSFNSSAGGSHAKGPAQWETAREEKAPLFNDAQRRVENTQQRPTPIDLSRSISKLSVGEDGPPLMIGSSSTRWESAADEKARLFKDVQERSSSSHGGSSSQGHGKASSSSAGGGSSTGGPTNGLRIVSSQPSYETAEQEKARLRRQYEQAQEAVTARQHRAGSTGNGPAGGSGSSQPSASVPRAGGSTLPASRPPATSKSPADEEKARLRYMDASQARDRVAPESSAPSVSEVDSASVVSPSMPPDEDVPIPYDAIFGEAVPTAIGSSGNDSRVLTEKEQQRRYYDAQEAVARSAMGFGPNSSSTVAAIPLPPVVAPPARHLTALEEKEILRTRDLSGSSSNPPPTSYPPSGSGRTSPVSNRASIVSSASSVPYFKNPEVTKGKQRAPRPISVYSTVSNAQGLSMSSSNPPLPPSSPPAVTNPPGPPPPPPPPPPGRPPDEYATRYISPVQPPLFWGALQPGVVSHFPPTQHAMAVPPWGFGMMTSPYSPFMGSPPQGFYPPSVQHSVPPKEEDM